MKILQIIHNFPPHSLAGTEIYTHNLSKELSKEHRIFVFHRISDLKESEYKLKSNKDNGLGIFTLNNTFRFCESFEKYYKNDDIAKQFIRILDEIKPDVVHIQHLIFLSTTIVAEIKKRNIPIIFTLHDYWLICPQWHFLKKNLTICNNGELSQCADCLGYQLSIKKLPKRIYLTMRGTIPGFLMRFLKNAYLCWTKKSLDANGALEKINSRRKHIKEMCQVVDMFIAPSRFVKAKFVEFGIPENKIKLIPHGIPVDSLKDIKRKEFHKIRFGFIGTILPAKGLDILIEAFNMIKDAPAELKIYGKLFAYQGFEYYPGYIKRLAKNGNIQFRGEFVHRDIARIFSEIDVLILPSIWNENCPLAILEAFSAKTPVIASRIGGIPELVKHKENGLLFEPRNIRDLYEKIKIVLRQPDLLEELKNGINPPKGIEENAQEIEKLYYALLNKDRF